MNDNNKILNRLSYPIIVIIGSSIGYIGGLILMLVIPPILQPVLVFTDTFFSSNAILDGKVSPSLFIFEIIIFTLSIIALSISISRYYKARKTQIAKLKNSYFWFGFWGGLCIVEFLFFILLPLL